MDLLPIFAVRTKTITAKPEILRLFGLKFYIYTRDHQPPHVHVVSADGEAKFIVGETVELDSNHGLKNKDIRLAESILEENKDIVAESWIKIHGAE